MAGTIAAKQAAFVEGRQISDLILIANEVVEDIHKSGRQGVVLKLDLEKDYDRVNWDFFDFVLAKKGFNPRWRLWIRRCFSSTSFSLTESLVKESSVLAA